MLSQDISRSLDEEYTRKTLKSKAAYEEAKNFLPGGVSYAIRYFEPYPFYVSRGRGSRIWDIDGNEYLDYWIGHGALIMGHAYRPVIEAAKDQLELGAHVGYCNEWEVRHAKQVVKMVPSAELFRPTNSGTEANMYATRLARTYTGRSKIAKFEGGWHGGSDALHKGVSYPFNVLPSAGIDEPLQKNTLVFPYNDLEGVSKLVRGQEEEIACFLIEPVLAGGGCIPAEKEFLKGLRELTERTGSLLIFDEVITGFRLAAGGAQEFYGITPDLTVFGKIIGGGTFPAGGFCGRREIMEKIDHLKFRKPNERSFHGGTYTGNPLVARAGYTLLSDLDLRRGEVYPYLATLGMKAREQLNDIFRKGSFQAHATGEGSIIGIHFTPEKPRDARSANETRNSRIAEEYFKFMLSKGLIFFTPQMAHCFISTAHTREDMNVLVSLTEEFVKLQR